MRIQNAGWCCSSIAVACIVGFSVIVTGPAAQAAFKCWTNKDGLKECGNAVPPEYAQQGHLEFNNQGVTVGRRDHAKSAEQFAEEQRLEATKQQAEETAKAKANEDRILLHTFSSEDDLLLARDGRVAEISGQVKLTEARNLKLEANLDHLVKSAADLERAGRDLPERLTKDIDTVRNQIADNKAFISRKRQESEDIRRKFDVDLKRWRDLKASR